MENKTKKILSEISAGELLDKISILEIKLEKITEKSSNDEVKKEYNLLKEIEKTSIKFDDKVTELFIKIKNINMKLWDVEDKLRVCEKNKDFGENFIKLAREVYFNNDKRSQVKLQINIMLGSNIREIKQYIKY
jgi:hypothetical protein